MLDPQLITQMVEKEIRSTIQQQVNEAVNQTEWIEDLEQQIIRFVQDRITARFSNIGTLPDLVATVEQKVGEMFANGFIPDLANYVDQPKIRQAVDLAVEKFIERTIENLTVDPMWVTKIENLVNERMQDRVRAGMRDIDMHQAIGRVVLENKETLTAEITKDFASQGIVDHASATQLTVMDGVVVVEGETVSRDITVERNSVLKGDVLIQGNLGVQGRIAVDNKSWQELSEHVGEVTYNRIKNDFAAELTESMLLTVKQGIKLADVRVGEEPLLNNGQLSSSIKQSSLVSVGNLETLQVDGRTDLSNTVTVVKGRVGINTEEPESALTIWDQEVAVDVGKFAKNSAYIGVQRRGNLVLGNNRQNYLEIDADGLTTIQRLKIGRNTIAWASETPNYSGTKGDIVFNLGASPENPFAWICLGAFRWQALKAVK